MCVQLAHIANLYVANVLRQASKETEERPGKLEVFKQPKGHLTGKSGLTQSEQVGDHVLNSPSQHTAFFTHLFQFYFLCTLTTAIQFAWKTSCVISTFFLDVRPSDIWENICSKELCFVFKGMGLNETLDLLDW